MSYIEDMILEEAERQTGLQRQIVSGQAELIAAFRGVAKELRLLREDLNPKLDKPGARPGGPQL